MKIAKWQVTGLLLGLLFMGYGVAAESVDSKQEVKQQKIEKKQKKGMKHKVKSYGEIVLEQTEALDLTDEQLGKIMRIQMANKKPRKELLDQPHKSMKKALKALRDPAADEASIRKAGATHTTDFDVFIEAEIKVRNKIDAVLTTKQRMTLKATKLLIEDKAAE